MHICGIVAEYNPFHNGHKYQIDKIRENGFDGIVAVMSGNVVQRGEFAFLEKHVRTKQALLNGVDLVIELPIPFVLSSAEKYALGAVSILDSLGVVDGLCFGSESSDMESLNKIADLNTDGLLSDYISEGVTYAHALSELIETQLGKEYSDILSGPNNVLGIEYLRALKKLGSSISPFTVKRIGVGHSDFKTNNGFCSAQYIRESFIDTDVSEYMPASSFELLNCSVKNGNAPVRLCNKEEIVLFSLRMKDEEYYKELPDISEGIENRLYSAVRNACSLDELYSLIKTKRYTMARVKRLVLNAFLGITDDYAEILPPYIRVLGFNEKGREILKNAKTKASIPIYTLYSDFKNADDSSKKYYELECMVTDVYNCFTPEIKPCGMEQTENAVIIK